MLYAWNGVAAWRTTWPLNAALNMIVCVCVLHFVKYIKMCVCIVYKLYIWGRLFSCINLETLTIRSFYMSSFILNKTYICVVYATKCRLTKRRPYYLSEELILGYEINLQQFIIRMRVGIYAVNAFSSYTHAKCIYPNSLPQWKMFIYM